MILDKLFNVSTKFYHKLEAPYFYTPGHYSISSLFLFLTLIPVYISVSGFFGLKILVLLALCIITGFIIEVTGNYLTKRYTGYFGFSTWIIFPLLTTPGFPLWGSLICFSLALIITQVLFGGYGRQVFHPAVTAQVLLMINFIKIFSTSFSEPFTSPIFGFNVYSSMSIAERTTLQVLKDGQQIDFFKLLTGPNTGYYSDIIPVIIIITGLIFLLFGGMNRKTPVSFIISLISLSFLSNLILPGKIIPFQSMLLAGSVMFYCFFIFSDRWTSPRSSTGRIIAGFVAALLTIVIRTFSSNAEGIMFAALFNYTFTPLYDELGFYLLMLKRKKEGESFI